MPFRTGLERIAQNARIPVLPVALDRLWGSIFSYSGGRAFTKLPRRFPYKVDIAIGEALSPDVDAFKVRQRIQEQIAVLRTERQGRRGSLAWRFLREARAVRHPRSCADGRLLELPQAARGIALHA